MNRDWFGDSYDVVKRFLVGAIRSLGYGVYVDPMGTGDWEACEPAFLEFLGARHVRELQQSRESALLIDPDIGIGARSSPRHTAIPNIAAHLERHSIVFVFDQSFSRSSGPREQLLDKLRLLEEAGAHGFYYDSHARFLFCSRSPDKLSAVREALLRTGLPATRLVAIDTKPNKPLQPTSGGLVGVE